MTWCSQTLPLAYRDTTEPRSEGKSSCKGLQRLLWITARTHRKPTGYSYWTGTATGQMIHDHARE